MEEEANLRDQCATGTTKEGSWVERQRRQGRSDVEAPSGENVGSKKTALNGV